MTLVPRRLWLALEIVLALCVLGVAGLMWLEHISFLDALLITVSAISTSGYTATHALGTAGKILAIVLTVGGLFSVALLISAMTEYFMEGHFAGAWERRTMDNAIARLKDHFIISGFGRVGREVARILTNEGAPFVVLDVNSEALATAKALDYLHVQEDPSHDEVLARVGITRARALLACADSDTSNVYVTLTARAMNPEIFIVARAGQPDAEPKLLKAGANRVVSPYVMAGRHIAELAARPHVTDDLNYLFDGKVIDVRIQEIEVSGDSELVGRMIKDLHAEVLGGAFVIALDRGDERMHDVAADVVVQAGDRLLVVGSGEQLRKLATIR